MKDQMDLPYGGWPPFQKHSETSKAAADYVEPKAGTLRATVLAYIRSTSGATDEEIMLGLDLDGNTVRPRRRELELAGLVKDSGQIRKTTRGRDAVVWKATRQEQSR